MQAAKTHIKYIRNNSDEELFTTAANAICDTCAAQLPILTHAIILLPHLRPAQLLYKALLLAAEKRGFSSLLLPRVFTLQEFITTNTRTIQRERRLISHQERLLILVREMRKYRYLYGEGSPWLLAENLLQLFDELTSHNIGLPQSLTAFTELLSDAYRIAADHTLLQREAQLVLTLWQAWYEQLEANNLIDERGHYLELLGKSLLHVTDDYPLFAIGLTQLLPAEKEWIQTLSQQNPFTWIQTADVVDSNTLTPPLGLLRKHDTSPYAAFLNVCYDYQSENFQTRIRQFRQHYPQSPVSGRLHILGVNQLEQHAQAIALFVRAALVNRAQHVGIVCEDLRLARRVRALLERSNIDLQDAVGWALSTTRAAAILESWLECIEQDFPHHAFLDLLKSPAFVANDDNETLNQIYRFEQDIVLHENIGSGLDRYRKAMHYRQARLSIWSPQIHQAIDALLTSMETNARRLQKFCSKSTKINQLLQTLIDSLTAIDRQRYFQTDAAGQAIFGLLQQLLHCSQHQPIDFEWSEFRGWLKRALEKEYFRPPTMENHSVLLLNLAQSELCCFDALVVGAADEIHFPGNMGRLPFFNDSVRTALGLPDWNQRIRLREHLFRRLLSSSPSILITWQQENNGESIAASPWVSAITSFHQQVYNQTLEPSALKQWLQRQELFPVHTDPETPVPVPSRPAPIVTANQVPDKLSVSAHQRLIDCPYRFYVYDILHLKPLDEVREALQKSDYGHRVHRCLEAFHVGVAGLAGPFNEQLTTDNRHTAIACMEVIARQVFAKDIEDNFQHRGWLQRWIGFIPQYIDWQITHGQEWHIVAGEQKTEIRLDEQTWLYGRVDRIEESVNGKNVIDYKTGQIPTQNQIINGEDIQLTSYSLLIQHVNSVQYLGLDERDGINDRNAISGPELQQLQTAVKQRLQNLLQRIRNGASLPAIGDEATCTYCDAKHICRRAYWQ